MSARALSFAYSFLLLLLSFFGGLSPGGLRPPPPGRLRKSQTETEVVLEPYINGRSKASHRGLSAEDHDHDHRDSNTSSTAPPHTHTSHRPQVLATLGLRHTHTDSISKNSRDCCSNFRRRRRQIDDDECHFHSSTHREQTLLNTQRYTHTHTNAHLVSATTAAESSLIFPLNLISLH